MSVTQTSTPDPARGIRTLLSVVLTGGILGVAAELALLEHFEDWKQWTPFAVLAVGLLTLAWGAVARTTIALRAHRAMMVIFLLTGALGVFFHYRGNVEFELEMVPSMGGFELVKEAMMGATPALAPGAMVLLGLVGLVGVYGHPSLTRDADGPR